MMLVLLAAVWWQTDQLSEARTRNKLLTETATGYEQVIQEVKTTAIQTHKLLAEVKVREQQRNAEGERVSASRSSLMPRLSAMTF
ncbi:hypothetical protein [Klebsiella michiganensis]|uniref:hypothetical protein n=2 Tax=Klebsiella TaxID=570 RepID=UPI001D0CF04B|nr:hypothetical protein [Klebsiella michiganensis]